MGQDFKIQIRPRKRGGSSLRRVASVVSVFWLACQSPETLQEIQAKSVSCPEVGDAQVAFFQKHQFVMVEAPSYFSAQGVSGAKWEQIHDEISDYIFGGPNGERLDMRTHSTGASLYYAFDRESFRLPTFDGIVARSPTEIPDFQHNLTTLTAFEKALPEYREWNACAAKRLLPTLKREVTTERQSLAWHQLPEVLYIHPDGSLDQNGGQRLKERVLSSLYTPLGKGSWILAEFGAENTPGLIDVSDELPPQSDIVFEEKGGGAVRGSARFDFEGTKRYWRQVPTGVVVFIRPTVHHTHPFYPLEARERGDGTQEIVHHKRLVIPTFLVASGSAARCNRATNPKGFGRQ